MEIIQKIRLGNSVPAIGAGALFYGDEQLYGEEHIPVPPTPDYSTMYLTLESLEDGNAITFTKVGSAPENTFYYSTNDGSTWTSANSDTTWSGLNTGSKVIMKATANQWATTTNKYWNFSSTKNYKVYGNIMSLLYGDNFIGQTTLSGKYAFCKMFDSSTYLTDASNLVLAATTLSNYCYQRMFYGCTSLTAAPELPATTLGTYCYTRMFTRCYSLQTAPELPATTLTTYCYQYMFSECSALTTPPTRLGTTLASNCCVYMFNQCSSLKTAPELPATTTVSACYQNMFYGCSALNYIKCLITNITAPAAFNNWVLNVASSGTFVKDASMTSWETATSSNTYRGIPENWTVVDAA